MPLNPQPFPTPKYDTRSFTDTADPLHASHHVYDRERPAPLVAVFASLRDAEMFMRAPEVANMLGRLLAAVAACEAELDPAFDDTVIEDAARLLDQLERLRPERAESVSPQPTPQKDSP